MKIPFCDSQTHLRRIHTYLFSSTWMYNCESETSVLRWVITQFSHSSRALLWGWAESNKFRFLLCSCALRQFFKKPSNCKIWLFDWLSDWLTGGRLRYKSYQSACQLKTKEFEKRHTCHQLNPHFLFLKLTLWQRKPRKHLYALWLILIDLGESVQRPWLANWSGWTAMIKYWLSSSSHISFLGWKVGIVKQ